jgi:hypothetical protein
VANENKGKAESFNATKRMVQLEGNQTLSEMKQLWDEIGRRTFPRKPNATYQYTVDFAGLIAADNYDSTLLRALSDHASGTSALLFPVTEQGFRLKPPRRLKDDDSAVRWCEECTEELSYQMLSNSNFRDALDEALLERITFGTGGCWSMFNGRKQRLVYRSAPVGTYVVGQDSDGQVNEIYARYEFTADQAATEWGHEGLPEIAKDRLGKEPNDNQESANDEYVVCVKEVMPWEDEIAKAAKGKQFYYRVEHKATGHVVVEEGFHEFPVSVMRYQPITGCPYGFTPNFFLMPEVRRLYRQQELADKLGLATLAPPLAALAKYEGMIRRGPLGITYVDDMDEAPVPLHSATGDIKFGMERIEDAKQDIERTLGVDFFKMFSSLDDPKITATMARLMEAEKAINLGSPYHRTSLNLTSIIQRSWAMLYRVGNFFADPPEAMQSQQKNPVTGRPDVVMPEVAFENRMVQALRGAENIKLAEWLEVMGPLLQAHPEELANFDLQQLTRRTFRNTVAVEDVMRPEAEVEELKQEMAEQAAQQQLEQMQMGADAANKAGLTAA